MNREEIARRRLHNQRLWGPPCADVEDVAGRMAAMQAQELAYAKWSVAQRAGKVLSTVDRALAEGTLLRIHVLRPTWHFVRAEDIRWILTLSAPRVHALNAYYYRQLELDAALFRKSRKLLVKALRGGSHLERKDLAVALAEAGIVASGPRLAYILMDAELEALICSGAVRGKQQTYALVDERAPRARALTRDEALSQLTRRYFESRGPATLKDYVQWASLTVAEAKRGLESVRSTLEHEVVDDRTYWFADVPARRAPASPRIDLVQIYDEYVMSYGESRDVLAPAQPPTGQAAGPAAYLHGILLDGQVIGRWRHAIEKGAVAIETQLYRKLRRPERDALDDAVARYGKFMGAAASLR
jgi:hypothetical protein